jgi:hypothetical protein
MDHGIEQEMESGRAEEQEAAERAARGDDTDD